MRLNQLPDGRDMAAMGQPVWSETSYDGIGFGLGFAVVIDPPKASIITSKGEHHWGGAASTFLDRPGGRFICGFPHAADAVVYLSDPARVACSGLSGNCGVSAYGY